MLELRIIKKITSVKVFYFKILVVCRFAVYESFDLEDNTSHRFFFELC